MTKSSVTTDDRFWAKVDKNGPVAANDPALGNCWLWTAYRNKEGYGGFHAAGLPHQAHRWAYERWVGLVPDGLVLDHFACDNTSCVNPAHVKPVTPRENIERGLQRSGWPGSSLPGRRKTHCNHGHLYDEENTYWTPEGNRQCRQCIRRRTRVRGAVAREEAAAKRMGRSDIELKAKYEEALVRARDAEAEVRRLRSVLVKVRDVVSG